MSPAACINVQMGRRLALVGGATMILVAISGCAGQSGPPSGTVTGSVKVDGQPLTGGSITFHATAADAKIKVSGGVIAADGKYSVPDAPVGVCKVTVTTGLITGDKVAAAPMGPGADVMKKMLAPPAGMPAMGSGAGGPGFIGGTKPVPIDASFTSQGTTPLSATVKRGANTFDFDVK
ncbi:MAG: hypothetical protein DWH79_12810 [Planctomycetota bacterium]|nr:MAG: hypothetical protein DWH79_12810 [Planctomycetota bacterium]